MAKRPPAADTPRPSRAGPPLASLLHGEDEVAINRARTDLIAALVAPEMRAESVTEIAPKPNSGLRLKSCLADILDELSTASFFPEHRRVVVVRDLAELTGKTAKEAEPLVARLAEFVRTSLREIGNAVIFVAVEEPDRWKTVQKGNAILRAVAEVGEVHHFPLDNLNFAFQDAILARKLPEALEVIERRLADSRASDRLGVLRAMFGDLVRLSRFLLQAKVARRGHEVGPETFPDDKRLNLLLQHPFVQQKVKAAAGRFKTNHLVALRAALQEANRHFTPSLEDAYVADQRLLLEHLTAKLLAEEP